VAGQLLYPGTLVFSTNKNYLHGITEILLKVTLNTIPLTLNDYLELLLWVFTPDHSESSRRITLGLHAGLFWVFTPDYSESSRRITLGLHAGFKLNKVSMVVITFVSDLWQVSCFIRGLWFSPQIKITSTV
jgi:hypothetical protein